MIDGIKLDFSSADLLAHIVSRAKHHQSKVAWYGEQLDALRRGGLTSQSATNDPVSSLEHSKQEHAQKAELFSVMAAHVVPDETYRLSESDLSRLEFISRYF